MEEILHHPTCMKPCKQWDIYHINWLAGYLNHKQYGFHASRQPTQTAKVPNLQKYFGHQRSSDKNHGFPRTKERLVYGIYVYIYMYHKNQPFMGVSYYIASPIASVGLGGG